MAGTSWEFKPLETIKIKLRNQLYEGNIEYHTHIQTYDWEKDFKKDEQSNGSSGKAKRLEAIKIRLTGDMEENYDVFILSMLKVLVSLVGLKMVNNQEQQDILSD